MGNFWRATVTAFIWLMCAIMGTVAISSGGSGMAWIIIPVLIAALIATGLVWISEAISTAAQARADYYQRVGEKGMRLEKSKRSGNDESANLALLLDMMDPDEREEFKNILKRRVLQEHRFSDDGEVFHEATPLEALFDEDERSARGG